VAIQFEGQFVADITQIGQPFRVLDDSVEQVAMGDPKLATVGGDMRALLDHLNAAETVFDISAGELVVVARHEHHTRALARFSQYFLYDIVVSLRPVPGPTQLPTINDVTHQVERFAFGVAQEVQKRCGLATGCSKVQVRDPDRAKMYGVWRILILLGTDHFGVHSPGAARLSWFEGGSPIRMTKS